MSKIDKVFDFFVLNHDFYSSNEIAVQLNLEIDVCNQILEFLVKYDFLIEQDEDFKMDQRIRKLFFTNSEQLLIEISPPP